MIAPGFIASDMTAKIDPKYEEAILKQIPLGEWMASMSNAMPIMMSPLSMLFARVKSSDLPASQCCMLEKLNAALPALTPPVQAALRLLILHSSWYCSQLGPSGIYQC